MKISDILEARSAPLYHWLEDEKAFNIFPTDVMPARWDHNIPGLGWKRGNSFTRNKNFKFGIRPIRLMMDQERLAQRYQIIPLDADLVYNLSHIARKIDHKHSDRRLHKDKNQFAEEFVIGDIRPLHYYITQIDVLGLNGSSAVIFSLMDTVKAYSEKFNIPVHIDQASLNVIEYFKKREEEIYDDEA